MELKGLPEPIPSILARADISALVPGTTINPARGLPASFMVPSAGYILLDPESCRDPAAAAVHLRHALELSLMLRLCPDRPVLAAFAAARTAALFAALERPRILSGEEMPSRMMGPDPIQPAEIAALWPDLALHQPDSPNCPPDGIDAALAALWPLLGPADWLMETGGDLRLRVDPATGLNLYGCSHRPRPWAVTYASSTASSCSERGYAGAEASRQRLLAAALQGRDGVAEELASVRQGIASYYGLPPGSAVALTASGTDGELFALALAQMHPGGRPVTNVLIAPEETGSGVPLAAAGRHFAIDTAGGAAVEKGALVEGFRDDTVLATVALRRADATLDVPDGVDAACVGTVDAAVEAGRRVLLHRLDVSKTGLLGPGLDAMRTLVARHAGHVDVIVDACQARLSAARVRKHVASGWMVMVTGSKFFTGPPFAGALLMPPAIVSRLSAAVLPPGLAAYSGRPEWSVEAAHQTGLAEQGNCGLALRWQAALAEMRAFAAVGGDARSKTLQMFTDRVRDGIAANPDLRIIDVPQLDREPSGEDWDRIGTIVSFAILEPARRVPLDSAAARDVYGWLNADLAPVLPAGLPVSHYNLARRRFHIGQPVKLACPDGELGALRISAGARLVSGEPFHARLPPDRRLEREVADALSVLAKISLILRHLPLLRAAAPSATYA